MTTRKPPPPPLRTPVGKSGHGNHRAWSTITWQKAQMVLLASSPDGQAAGDAAHGESGLGQGRAEASSIKESYFQMVNISLNLF